MTDFKSLPIPFLFEDLLLENRKKSEVLFSIFLINFFFSFFIFHFSFPLFIIADRSIERLYLISSPIIILLSTVLYIISSYPEN